jgi:GMP reductase
MRVAAKIQSKFGTPVKMICVDIANGYLDVLVQKCSKIREIMPDDILMAGNVVTPEGMYELVHKGYCDIIKVGIGSGAACTTRLKTGVGYPQFSAVVECASAAKSYGCHIISDGGAVFAGDCAKAFAANSSFVMLGSMLAGHNESPGELIVDPKTGKSFKEYYGMSSKRANEKYFGGLQSYRAAEGKLTHIPVKGSLEDTIQDIEGGIRSACTYVNAESLEELSQNAVFVEVKQTYNGSLDQYVVGRI